MKKKISVVGSLLLLCALLLGSCGGKTDPPAKTEPDSIGSPTVTTTEPASGTTAESPTEEVTTGEKEEVKPTVDIETVQAKSKTLIGKTDKDAIAYAVGEEMTFTVRLDADGKTASCPKFKYILNADDGRAQEEKLVDGKSGVLTLKTKLNVAGFVHLQVTVCDKDGKPIDGVGTFDGGAAAGIADIRKKKAEPADFDQFWKNQLAKLDETAPELLEDKEVKSPKAKHTVYAVKIRFCEENTWGDYVSGYLSVPKNAKAESLGLYVTFQGYGVGDPAIECASGKATLALSAHSMDVGKPSWYYVNLNGGKLKDYGFKSDYNATRETVYFREMLLRDVQGVRFLKKYFGADGPDERFKGLWSEKKGLILSGGSQGGFQAAAVTALEPGATQLMLYIPWMCDVGGCGTDGRQKGTFMPAYTEALEYYDTVNFAKRITCPVFIESAGLGDYVATPAGIASFYNNLTACPQKRIVFKQNFTHAGSLGNSQNFTLSQKNS